MVDGVLAGEVALPAGDVPEPFVDVEDIADVAVAALTEDGHHGQVYELTGPRALTFDEAVGRDRRRDRPPVRFVPRAGRRLPRRDARGRRARRTRPSSSSFLFTRGARRPQRRAAGRRPARARPRARATSASTPATTAAPGCWSWSTQASGSSTVRRMCS